jgi:hypothetical protein
MHPKANKTNTTTAEKIATAVMLAIGGVAVAVDSLETDLETQIGMAAPPCNICCDESATRENTNSLSRLCSAWRPYRL